MANPKHECALPTENRRKTHITFRDIGTDGAEHATSVTLTNEFPFRLNWIGQIHNGYVHDNAASLVTRIDLIKELAKKIVHYLARHPTHHIEVIVGFASENNAFHSASLQSIIMREIIACNTPVLKESEIQKFLNLKEYLFLIQQLLILAPTLFRQKKTK